MNCGSTRVLKPVRLVFERCSVIVVACDDGLVCIVGLHRCATSSMSNEHVSDVEISSHTERILTGSGTGVMVDMSVEHSGACSTG